MPPIPAKSSPTRSSSRNRRLLAERPVAELASEALAALDPVEEADARALVHGRVGGHGLGVRPRVVDVEGHGLQRGRLGLLLELLLEQRVALLGLAPCNGDGRVELDLLHEGALHQSRAGSELTSVAASSRSTSTVATSSARWPPAPSARVVKSSSSPVMG